MSDSRTRRPVVLDHLPAATFRAAILYLDDVLRECQLVLSGHAQSDDVDPTLVGLAEGIVPDIEELRDAFRAAELSVLEDGSLRMVGELEVGQSGTIAHLQVQLIQLRLLGRRGGLLLESDPQVTHLLAWLWEETADQLHGRDARPYRPPT